VLCRYADDSNTYVRSEAAGRHLLRGMKAFLEERLKLRINDSKSACARVRERKFLGYTLSKAGDTVRSATSRRMTRQAALRAG
jgi:RNA-directed DNA polymerase